MPFAMCRVGASRGWGGQASRACRRRAAALRLTCVFAVIGAWAANASFARADEPRYSAVVNADYAAAANDPPVAAVLDELELEVAALAAGRTAPSSAADIESDARAAWRRARTATDKSRAEILIRRAARLAGRPHASEPDNSASRAVFPEALAAPALMGAGFASLAQYLAPGLAAPLAPSDPLLGGPPPGAVMAGPPGPVGGPLFSPYAMPAPRHYLSLDALGWWVKADQVPALVTTSPIGTAQTTAGVLGQPTTSVLFGDQSVNGGIRPGGRVQGGVWLDDNAEIALEGSYYALATAATTYSASSTFSTGTMRDPILARPFFNIAPLVNHQSSVLVAYPNLVVPPIVINVDGSVQVREASNIQSAGAGGRIALNQYTMPVRVFLVGGYRFFDLNESLSMIANSSPGTGPFPSGRLSVLDEFSTRNYFNGGEVGLGAVLRQNRWSLAAETRLAMGNMQQILTIDGRTEAISGGFIAMYPGGLLAQPTNMGTFIRNRFALIPQVDLKVGYQLLPSLRVTLGYNFTYVTQLLRPGEQVDTTVNTTQIAAGTLVGPARPQVSFSESSIWLQGVTAGLQLAF